MVLSRNNLYYQPQNHTGEHRLANDVRFWIADFGLIVVVRVFLCLSVANFNRLNRSVY